MPRRNNQIIHQPFRMAQSCEQKRRYPTEKLARATAEHQMLITPHLELAVYKCDLCTGWHLTRQSHKDDR